MTFIILPLLILAWAIFWVCQFVLLMALQDDILPGRHDKVLWFIAFLVCPLFTPFAFLLLRKVRLGAKTAC